MKEYRGILKRIGDKEGDMIVNSARGGGAVGNVRVSGTVSIIEIGDTMLRNVGCTRDIYALLDQGKEAVLYVHYHFFHKPIILGVTYPEERRTYVMPFMSMFANAVMYLVMYPLFFLIGGLVSTMFLGKLGYLIILGGLGLSVYNAVTLVTGYLKAAATT
ncbi:hypothetical protein BH09PSE1_BH09PSE1_00840 [soil metagenome]